MGDTLGVRRSKPARKEKKNYLPLHSPRIMCMIFSKLDRNKKNHKKMYGLKRVLCLLPSATNGSKPLMQKAAC
jgi:hypothetical protein